MNSIPSSSGQLPVYPQASSLNTASSDGCRLAKQQESLSRLKITDDQSSAGSTPSPVNITDRSASIPASPATYDYVLPFDGETYKVTTEQFTYDDGSCGLNLMLENGDRFLQCSRPFSEFTRHDRKYNDPDFDEDEHIAKLMLIKDSSGNEGCLSFLTRNNIVKVVGKVESRYVDFPIVQLLANRKSSEESSAAASVDSLSSRIDAFSGRILVPPFKEFQQFLSRGMNTKKRMPDQQVNMLKKYIGDRKLSVLEKSSFIHIAIFMDYGKETPRLPIACSDYGYSLEELEQLRRENKSSVDVAFDVILREQCF